MHDALVVRSERRGSGGPVERSMWSPRSTTSDVDGGRRAFLTVLIVASSGLLLGFRPAPQGTIVVNQKGDVTLHSFVAPDDSYLVTSHVIETRNRLVIVDAQILLPLAREVRTYAESLGKPIDRLILSHAHADHWLGLEVFSDVPIHATSATRDQIDASGDRTIARVQGMLGTTLISGRKVVPDRVVGQGSEIIDGLTYEYDVVFNAEAAEQLVIRLPQLGTVIAQDVVFNMAHFYLGARQFAGWIKALDGLRALEAYDTILCGHGRPIGVRAYEVNLEYLRAAQAALASATDAAAFRAALIARYPDYGAVNLLDLSLPLLYPSDR